MRSRGFARAGPAFVMLIIALTAIIAPISTAGAAEPPPTHPCLIIDDGPGVNYMSHFIGTGGAIEASTSTTLAGRAQHSTPLPARYAKYGGKPATTIAQHSMNRWRWNAHLSNAVAPARMLGTASWRRLDMT